MVAVTVAEERIVGVQHTGCFSVEYIDPSDEEYRCAMDYNWHKKNEWTSSESPTTYSRWDLVQRIREHGYRALLAHFGLEEDDISFGVILTKSPADIVRIRRVKEDRYGLECKVIKNMRTGCPRGELADTFEARP